MSLLCYLGVAAIAFAATVCCVQDWYADRRARRTVRSFGGGFVYGGRWRR